MKVSKQNLEKYVGGFLLFFLTFIIYLGLCKIFGIEYFSDLDTEDDGGRFPRNGSFFLGIAFIGSYLIISKSVKAIVNLKSKKQQDEYLNEFYNFKQRYGYLLSKSPYLYRTIDEVQKKLLDSYKWLVNISDFDDISDYKKATYELIRFRLDDLIYGPYGFGNYRNADFNAIIELYKEMLKDRSVYNESDNSKYLNDLSEVLKE